MKREVKLEYSEDINYYYLTIERFCELKNIGKTTFFQKFRYSNNFEVVKLYGKGKSIFIKAKKTEMQCISKSNEIFL